jgi:hypothetical protein
MTIRTLKPRAKRACASYSWASRGPDAGRPHGALTLSTTMQGIRSRVAHRWRRQGASRCCIHRRSRRTQSPAPRPPKTPPTFKREVGGDRACAVECEFFPRRACRLGDRRRGFCNSSKQRPGFADQHQLAHRRSLHDSATACPGGGHQPGRMQAIDLGQLQRERFDRGDHVRNRSEIVLPRGADARRDQWAGRDPRAV